MIEVVPKTARSQRPCVFCDAQIEIGDQIASAKKYDNERGTSAWTWGHVECVRNYREVKAVVTAPFWELSEDEEEFDDIEHALNNPHW